MSMWDGFIKIQQSQITVLTTNVYLTVLGITVLLLACSGFNVSKLLRNEVDIIWFGEDPYNN